MKNIVVLLVASVVVGFVSSEVAFRRNVGRLQRVEDRLGAIDRNLASLNERHAKVESAIELLLKADEAQARASNQDARLPSGFVTQLAFMEFRTKTENTLQEILDALESHDEQLTQLQDDLLNLADDVEKNAAAIAELEKQ